jgi:transcriptional regulator with XRE-family HTH domain
MFALSTPEEIARDVASKVKARRLDRNMTQDELASRSAMKVATYRLFERTGQISFTRLLRIAVVLDAVEAFDDLFRPPPISSLDELTRTPPKRTRARTKR